MKDLFVSQRLCVNVAYSGIFSHENNFTREMEILWKWQILNQKGGI
jgi:hypothetical protein